MLCSRGIQRGYGELHAEDHTSEIQFAPTLVSASPRSAPVARAASVELANWTNVKTTSAMIHAAIVQDSSSIPEYGSGSEFYMSRQQFVNLFGAFSQAGGLASTRVSVNQSIKQSTNQSTNQSIHHRLFPIGVEWRNKWQSLNNSCGLQSAIAASFGA